MNYRARTITITSIMLAMACVIFSNQAASSQAINSQPHPHTSLYDDQLLQVRAFLEPAGTVVARQNTKLVIETATSGWFTGGTKITPPEVPGLLILQNEKFASNASERRNGKPWVTQRWTMDAYPMRAGTFSIPPIALSVRLKTPENQEVSGLRTTNAIELTAALPPALESVTDWVAAPAYSVRQTFDRPVDKLSVGDAIEQTIELKAADVMAMMLPVYRPPDLDGLAAYPAPPQLENRINRGQNAASRTTVINYIVEEPGHFVLPAQDFFWWNTKEQQLELLTIPAVTLQVAGASVINRSIATTTWGTWLLILAVMLAVLLLIAAVLKGRTSRSMALITRKAQRLQMAIANLRRPTLPDRLNP